MREAERLQRARHELLGHLRAEEHRLELVHEEQQEKYLGLCNEVQAVDEERCVTLKQLAALRVYVQELSIELRPTEAQPSNGESS